MKLLQKIADIYLGIDKNDSQNIQTKVGQVYQPYKDALGNTRYKLKTK